MNRTYRHITNIGKANRKALRSVLISAMLLAGVTTTAQVTVNGNVYGGGNLAKVHGTVTVTINQDGAQVVGDVYGGGAKADVNTSDGTNLTAGATTTVTLTKGTVRDVYGGGHGDLASLNVAPETGHEDREANVFGAVTVNVNGGSARNVYGCNNLNGAPQTSVQVNISAGEVTKDVYGGGNLASTTLIPEVNVTGGTVSQDVYGGGALADTGGSTVNITGGTVTRNIYGGGLGDEDHAALVNGAVAVNIGAAAVAPATEPTGNATIGGSVYGCNNVNGTPKGNVQVNIYKTAHTTTDAAAYLTDDGVHGDPTFAIANVFGGGNQASYEPDGTTNKATVHVYGCNNTIKDVFGGGDAAAAKGVVTVIDGSRIGRVFGGGNGEVTAANIGDGGISLTVHGGYIGKLFAASNERGTISGTITVDVDNTGGCGEDIAEFFCGSNKADLTGDLVTTIKCGAGTFGDLYGGCNLANITGNVTLNIYGGTFDNVYGGSKGLAAATGVEAKAADITGNVTLNLYGGTIDNAFGGSNVNGNIKGVITVNMLDLGGSCGLSVNNIYGASNQTPYTPNDLSEGVKPESPIVNLINGTVSENVFGGALGSGATVTANPIVRVGYDATTMSSFLPTTLPTGYSLPTAYKTIVVGNVYGGGDAAAVAGSTSVTYNDNNANSTVGKLFGGGNAAGVSSTATVTLTSGKVTGGIYGGCNSSGTVVGNIAVALNGGTIGAEGTPANVHGGGYGNETETSGNVTVTVNGSTIYGDVYGGSALGNVNDAAADATTVTLTSGTINGNIYGGGLGQAAGTVADDPTTTDVDESAAIPALVKGAVTVNINGGTVNDVFGCNNLYGSPQSTVLVNINETTPNTLTVRDVFGGGNYATASVAPTVDITAGSVRNVFGGGNEAGVAGSIVNVNGGTITTGLYGGCNTSGTVSGDINVNVYANIGTDADNKVDIFGGGYGATTYTEGNVTVTIDKSTGDGATAPVIFGDVYGGSSLGEVGASEKTAKVDFKNGTLNGSIFGGGKGDDSNAAAVSGAAQVAVSGGTVKTGVYGGCNANGNVVGDITVTLTGGTVGVSGTESTTNTVFGGGYGSSTTTGGNIGVTLNGTTVYGSLYGGSALGSVNGSTENTTTVTIQTATLHGSVYGGCMGDNTTQAESKGNATVTINACNTDFLGIFGGANVNGLVKGDIVVNIYDNVGAAGSPLSIFGGGYGADTDTEGNVTVNIGTADGTADDAKIPVIYGDIYGGSALGNVNDAASEKTTVNFLNGTLKTATSSGITYGNIYGGGLGQTTPTAIAAKVNGQVEVNIGTSTQTDAQCKIDLREASIFGCNNTNGSPQDNVTVNIYKTAHTAKDAATYSGSDATYAIKQVFGGGNQANYAPENGLATSAKKATVNIYSCDNTIESVYGGGNAAAATGVATNIDGGRFDYVYGGGNGVNTPADIGKGGTNLQIHGGTINNLFGGSNSQGSISGAMVVNVDNTGCSDNMYVDEFFCGNNAAAIGSAEAPVDVTATIACGTRFGTVYGGCNLAPLYGNVDLTIEGGVMDYVYGGSKGDLASLNEELGETGHTNQTANIYGNVTLTVKGGQIKNVFGGSNNNGNITGTITVNIEKDNASVCEDGWYVGNVYGASNRAAYTPTPPGNYPAVNIKNGTVNGNVYGGGKGATAIVTSNPVVTIGDNSDENYYAEVVDKDGDTEVDGTTALVGGNVFGGGYAAPVVGDTKVIYNDTHASSHVANIFGGGNEADVTNTTVEISAGQVKGNVYGGGNLGDVGRIVKSADYNHLWTDDATADPVVYNGTGVCNVTITGGTIGAEGASTDNHASGHVFGAGKGVGDSFYCGKGMVYKTNVSISKGTIYGNVYGGGQVGRVENDAIVLIDGTNDNDTEIKGDVFGAGAGIETHGYSALLRGDATVTVQGKAQVGGSVYGGGETASVGRFRVENSLPKEPLSGGTCTVTIKGNAEIGTSGTGSVYGACKGVTPDFANNKGHVINTGASVAFTDEADYLAFLKTLALTSNTEVTIDGGATVSGSVYGGGQRGITLGDVQVSITGGTVTSDVYGGGALADTNTGNWNADYGTVAGLTAGTSVVTGYYTRTGAGTEASPYVYTVTTDATAVDGKTYYSKNSWSHAVKKSALYTTKVSLMGGTVGNAYGGGLGDANTPAYVWGDVLVDLNGTTTYDTDGNILTTPITTKGCIVNKVFGCNNVNGTPKGEVLVHVHATQRNATGDITVLSKASKNSGAFDVQDVYGGGNEAEYYPVRADDADATEANHVHTNVIIEGCNLTSIKRVFGGGNAASSPSTSVTVNGAWEIDEVFGGGNGENGKAFAANVGFHKYDVDTEDTKAKRLAHQYGFGKAQVNIGAGTIHAVYGGSNRYGNVRNVAIATLDHLIDGCDFNVGKAYGGGKAAEMDGRAILNLGCIDQIDEVYGGAESANVDNDVELNITNGTYKKVYGGNNTAGRIYGTITVNIEETGCKPIIIDELYGGGNHAPYYATDIPNDANHASLDFTDETADNYYLNYPKVNVISATRIGKVFGGGDNAAVTGNPHVKVDMEPGVLNKGKTGATTQALGTIGQVFGGGNNAGVTGNTYVEIVKGQIQKVTIPATATTSEVVINPGVYGGCNTEGTVSGDTHVTLKGTTTTAQPIATIGESAALAEVCGGGLGKDTKVSGTAYLNVGTGTAGTISTYAGAMTLVGDIYGGSAFGEVNNAEVNIFSLKDNTFGYNVYGGGKGQYVSEGSAENIQAKVTGTATVNLYATTITGSVYGGCNVNGESAHAVVNLIGGQVGTATANSNVFGGGKGAHTSFANGGTVTVNMGSKSTATPPVYSGTTEIFGDIYGGSENGSVKQVDMYLYGGKIHGDAYGGGYDTAEGLSSADDINVTLEGTAFYITYYDDAGHTDVVKSGRVFGCNNLSGSPQGNVTVTVNKTTEGNTPRTDATKKKSETEADHTYELAAVYGGGNLAPYTAAGKKTHVIINGCDATSILTVYGGGNAAAVPETDVDVNAAYEIGAVFGGGNGKDPYKTDAGWVANPGANVNGNANTMLYGGTVHEGYGGSNQKGSITGTVTIDVGTNNPENCPLDVEKIVGAGKNADITGDLKVIMGCKPGTKIPLVYGGADNANVNGDVELTITSGNFGKVFGGNNEGGAILGHIILNIEETGECETPITIEELYLGGNMAPYSVYGYYKDSDGKLQPRKSATDGTPVKFAEGEYVAYTGTGGDTFKEYDRPTLNIVSCTRIDSLYGGGYGTGATLYGDPIVNINMIKGHFANDDTKGVPYVMGTLGLTSTDNPNNLGIIGDVFGGGNAAAVIGHTTVNIGTETTVQTHQLVKADGTYQMSDPVNVEGAYIRGNIYGGGNLADVGYLDDDTKENDPNSTYRNTYVNIGAKEGTSGYQSVTLPEGAAGIMIAGNVFGGGKGKADNFKCDKGMIVGETNVHIGNGTVGGNVYGGGEVGRVEKSTAVTIGFETTTSKPVVKGSVFGAGNGVSTHGYSALVRGNSNVTVQGDAKVEGSVYGGGETASVGRYYVATTAALAAEHNVEEGEPYDLISGGTSTVVITDNAVIGLDDMVMNNTTTHKPDDAGHVFGAGKGVLPYDPNTYNTTTPGRYYLNNGVYTWEAYDESNEDDYLKYMLTLALSNETDVTISGNAFVKGSVYGGSENGHVRENTLVKIQGGQIGAGYDTSTGKSLAKYDEALFIDPATTPVTTANALKTCAAWSYDKETTGNPYDMYAGTASYDSKGGALVATDGHTFFGNVFGGGSGYYPYAAGKWLRSAGSVGGNTVINITGGHILSNVYGGNEQTDIDGGCTITMSGGTIGVPRTKEQIQDHPVVGNLFGAGKGDKRVLFNTWTNVVSTSVNVTGGIVYGSVFGGGEDGHVIEDATTTIKEAAGKTITIGSTGESGADGNVFGGGRGSETALTAGVVGGNVNLTIESGNILGSVYGGGRLASVGTNFVTPDNTALYGKLQTPEADHGNITIDIKGGVIGTANSTGVSGNIYGGSKGTSDFELGIVRSTKINMTNGTAYASIYGGGELAQVVGSHTTDGEALGTEINISGSPYIGINEQGKGGATYGNVYGGGKGSIDYAEAGLIKTNTRVKIEGTPTIYHNIYGGGAYGSVGTFTFTTGTPTGWTANTGKAEVIIDGGTIGINGQENGMVFGSSRGDVAKPVGTPAVDPNDKLAWVYDTHVVIGSSTGKPAIKGTVYGSGENGHTFNNTVLDVHNGTIGIASGSAIGTYSGAAYPYRGNVYGGGCGTDMYDSDNDGTEDTYNPMAGIVLGNATINIDGGQVVRNVYGAGAMGSVGVTKDDNTISGGQTTINISNGTVGVDGTAGDGNVFGAARGALDATGNSLALVSGATNVSITGGTMYGNVYGGGELGYVGKFTAVVDATSGSKTYTWPENVGTCNVTIDGGSASVMGHVFGAGKGSAETFECEPAMVRATNVIIKNGTVNGTVYGGGEIGRVDQDTEVTIGTKSGTDSPEIKGNVFGAGDGLATHGYSALVRGDSKVTVQGKAKVGKSVYGGGETASVGRFKVVNSLPKEPLSGGTCTVTIQDDAQIGTSGTGDVYGACKGVTPDYANNKGHVINTGASVAFTDEADYLAFLKTLALTSNTEVTIDGGATVSGSVYGGGQRGITLGSVEVDVIGGTVNQDVYGGGALADTNTGNATGYGTSTESISSTSTYTTTVNLKGGHIKGDAYGGALGDADTPAYVYGNVLVDLNNIAESDKGCVINRIFGANNVNGTPLGHVKVHVHGTQNEGTASIAEKKDSGYDMSYVFGGGNNADYTPIDSKQSTEVIIEGCELSSIYEVYGSGYGAASPATLVLVKGTKIIENVFGGGYGAGATNPGANVGYHTDKSAYTSGDGKAIVHLMAGKIINAYGASNTKGDIRGGTSVTSVDNEYDGSKTCCPNLEVNQIFGGGKDAEMKGGANIVLDCMPDSWIGEIYAGAENADVNDDVSLTIISGKFGRVFGGNKKSGKLNGGITVNIEESGKCGVPIIIGELYAGGNLAPYSIYGYKEVTEDGTTVTKARESATDGTAVGGYKGPYKDPVLNVRSFTSIGNIYGGGYGAKAVMVGNPTVNINEVMVEDDADTGSTNKYYKGETRELTDLDGNKSQVTLLEHEAGKMGVIGSVFGGGNAAEVIGNTNVNVGTTSEEPFISLPVNDSTGKKPTDDGWIPTYQKKSVVGADIRGNVYGGGNAANVTGKTNVVIGKKN